MPSVNRRKILPAQVNGAVSPPSDEIVSDNSEWTAEEMQKARPFSEVFPELMQSMHRSRGRPLAEVRKQQISIRLDAEVIEKFKATGKGWQARINEALRKAAADF